MENLPFFKTGWILSLVRSTPGLATGRRSLQVQDTEREGARTGESAGGRQGRPGAQPEAAARGRAPASGTNRPGRRWGRALGARTKGLKAAPGARLPAGGGGRGRCGTGRAGGARRKCRLRRRLSRAGRDVVPVGARRPGGRGRAAGAGAAGAGAAAPPGAEAAATRRAAAAAAPAPGVLVSRRRPGSCGDRAPRGRGRRGPRRPASGRAARLP